MIASGKGNRGVREQTGREICFLVCMILAFVIWTFDYLVKQPPPHFVTDLSKVTRYQEAKRGLKPRSATMNLSLFPASQDVT